MTKSNLSLAMRHYCRRLSVFSPQHRISRLPHFCWPLQYANAVNNFCDDFQTGSSQRRVELDVDGMDCEDLFPFCFPQGLWVGNMKTMTFLKSPTGRSGLFGGLDSVRRPPVDNNWARHFLFLSIKILFCHTCFFFVWLRSNCWRWSWEIPTGRRRWRTFWSSSSSALLYNVNVFKTTLFLNTYMKSWFCEFIHTFFTPI